MVTIVPSRFAGLKIEDDDDNEEFLPKKSNKNLNCKHKLKQQQTLPANQSGKNSNKSKKTNQYKKKRTDMNDEHWKQWQERDKEFADTTYEKDLEQALLLSKLDLEENLCTEKSDIIEKKHEKSKGKGRKSQRMNLHQFNQMLENKTETKAPSLEIIQDNAQGNFFENINEQARNIVRKEDIQNIGQTQKNKTTSTTKPVSTNEILISKDINLKSPNEMEKLREENAKLSQEMEALKQKLKNVAVIIKHAEIKEKVDLLLEIQELKKVQEQMSIEMSRLYIELEQEKSRASQATQYHSDYNRLENKSLRSALKSVRFDERSFFKN
ncbi:G kinase-anchoring protein 1-like [Culicoides brevitarsis]|uniref:G kinase-anchoring protein 1-like n=1 Tax=Culicoides brevitarsis TaxID=469753 RepID=UPI00307BCB8D